MHQPSKMDILKFVSDEIHGESVEPQICVSQIEKDMHYMRNEWDAPIKYKKGITDHGTNGFYFYDGEFHFWKGFLQTFDSYMDLPKEIKEIIYE